MVELFDQRREVNNEIPSTDSARQGDATNLISERTHKGGARARVTYSPAISLSVTIVWFRFVLVVVSFFSASSCPTREQQSQYSTFEGSL